jgi:hypothetical protein
MGALTAFVLLTSAPFVLANTETTAVQKAAEALMVQLEIDKMFQDFLNKNVGKDTQKILGNVGLVIKSVQDQKISYTWEF